MMGVPLTEAGRGTRNRVAWIVCALFLAWPVASFPGEKEEEGDSLESELMDEFAFLQEEDVVFTAAKHEQKAGFSPSAVIVITRREIEESGATTLAELLRLWPPVHVYEFDPLYPTIRIRGTMSVLLTIDDRILLTLGARLDYNSVSDTLDMQSL